MIHKKIIRLLCICLIVFGVVSVSGCTTKQDKETAEKTNEEVAEKETTEKETTEKETTEKETTEKETAETEKDKADDVIIAGSVDTASKYSFTVEEALVGLSYNDEPIVVLVGAFTNNSDETISFSWALDVAAMQDGYTLPTAYLSGSGDFNYNEIDSGSTIPVLIGWKLADGQNDITLTVIDRQHYAKEEIYSQTFTIDELIKNTEGYQDSDDVIEKPL